VALGIGSGATAAGLIIFSATLLRPVRGLQPTAASPPDAAEPVGDPQL
jgi:hypothetical protein